MSRPAEHVAFFEQKLREIDDQILACEVQRSALKSARSLGLIRLRLAGARRESANLAPCGDLVERVHAAGPRIAALELDLQHLEHRRAYVVRQLDAATQRDSR
jgi:hypothetical protein